MTCELWVVLEAAFTRATLEAIVIDTLSIHNTALVFEFRHTDGVKRSRPMMFGGIVMGFMNWDGGVYDFWLDDLLVDHWLNCLMDVMMNMLPGNSRIDFLGFLFLRGKTLILERSSFLLESIGDMLLVAVVMSPLLHGHNVVAMLLGQYFGILHRLNRGVMVIFVNLFVNSCLDRLMACWLDSLPRHCRSRFLLVSRVIMTGFGHEVTNCLLRFLHFV